MPISVSCLGKVVVLDDACQDLGQNRLNADIIQSLSLALLIVGGVICAVLRG
eukprot:COSAG05_NODE_130_length_17165_cov_154.623638_5_plen_52_part_00